MHFRPLSFQVYVYVRISAAEVLIRGDCRRPPVVSDIDIFTMESLALFRELKFCIRGWLLRVRGANGSFLI